ncbi:hypothetical protein [Aliarcobacter thereius]|nr:hypothetical protein [Aliarcobacter thereius]
MILIENNLEQKDIKKIEKLSKKLDIFDKPLTRKRVNSFGFYFKITNIK